MEVFAMPAELLMFEEPGCEWCERWNDDVGIIYHKTPEGRRAPLRRVTIRKPLPESIRLKRPATYTPTFVLLEEGREIGRITGYPGEDFFWGYLAELIAKLQSKPRAPAQPATGASVRS